MPKIHILSFRNFVTTKYPESRGYAKNILLQSYYNISSAWCGDPGCLLCKFRDDRRRCKWNNKKKRFETVPYKSNFIDQIFLYFLNPEEPLRILARDFFQLIRVHSTNLCNLIDDIFHKKWFVDFAAMGDGGEVGRVGFD